MSSLRTRVHAVVSFRQRPACERWFAELTNKFLRRSAHGAVAQLEAAIRAWLASWNENCHESTTQDTSVGRLSLLIGMVWASDATPERRSASGAAA